MCFIEVREQFATIQAVLNSGATIGPVMIQYAGAIPKESIIEIKAKVSKCGKPVQSCSIQTIELQIEEIFTVNKSASMLPF